MMKKAGVIVREEADNRKKPPDRRFRQKRKPYILQRII